MASATDVITYIGVPLTVLGVIPIFYNTVQCVIIRQRLLRSLPAIARPFVSLQSNPVGGNVLCAFKKPAFNFHDIIANIKDGKSEVNAISLDHIECEGLSASWMRLVCSHNLLPRHKKQAHRMIVDSSLSVDPLTLECSWRAFVFLALGLGISATDLGLHDLGENGKTIHEEKLLHSALLSENGQTLMKIRWQEAGPSLELTKFCRTWSIRRSLAHFLHMVVEGIEGQTVLHFISPTAAAGHASPLRVCDCRNIMSDPTEFSRLKDIRYALPWTLYLEQLLRREVGREYQKSSKIIPVPQFLLLAQFEITESLRQMPAPKLHSYVSKIFPHDAASATKIISALENAWLCSEHQRLLREIGVDMNLISLSNRQRSEANSFPLLDHEPQPIKMDSDIEKALGSEVAYSSKDIAQADADLLTCLENTITFQNLASLFDPFHAVTNLSNQAVRSNLASGSSEATIDIEDPGNPEGFLARVMIALSQIRHLEDPISWGKSNAKGKMRFAISSTSEAGGSMIGKLLEYEERTIRIT